MKNFILFQVLLIGLFVNAQDFKNISSPNEAIAQASILASKSSNSKLLNSQNFAEDNLFAVRFIPVEMSSTDYDKLDSVKQNQCLTVVFKTFDNTFIIKAITGSYDVIFDIWKTEISKEDHKEKEDKKYFDKEKKIVYLLSEDNDERWKITRQQM